PVPCPAMVALPLCTTPPVGLAKLAEGIRAARSRARSLRLTSPIAEPSGRAQPQRDHAADTFGWRRDTLLLNAADRLDQLLVVPSHSSAVDELVTHHRPFATHVERHFGRTRRAGPATETGADLPQDARVKSAHRTVLQTADELSAVPVQPAAAA